MTGCTQISTGCLRCYAQEIIDNRFGKTRGAPFNEILLHDHRLLTPTKHREPSVVLTCSMGDLFHEDVPWDFLLKVFFTMNHPKANHHKFLVLTKRPQTMRDFIYTIMPRNDNRNIWLGTSIENSNFIHRYNVFGKMIPAYQRHFVSIEPLLGFISMPALGALRMTNWIIAGGESGKNARPCKPEWVRSIRDFCIYEKIPFFFKGWGKHIPTGQQQGLLDGREYHEYPKDLIL